MDRQEFLRLADACLESGEHDKGLDAIQDALDTAEDTGELCWPSELYRLRGELTLGKATGGVPDISSLPEQAESDFRRALSDAGQRGAKSLELRAACSLAHLLRVLERSSDAESLLNNHYTQWDDDVTSADLSEAKNLLNQF